MRPCSRSRRRRPAARGDGQRGGAAQQMASSRGRRIRETYVVRLRGRTRSRGPGRARRGSARFALDVVEVLRRAQRRATRERAERRLEAAAQPAPPPRTAARRGSSERDSSWAARSTSVVPRRGVRIQVIHRMSRWPGATTACTKRGWRLSARPRARPQARADAVDEAPRLVGRRAARAACCIGGDDAGRDDGLAARFVEVLRGVRGWRARRCLLGAGGGRASYRAGELEQAVEVLAAGGAAVQVRAHAGHREIRVAARERQRRRSGRAPRSSPRRTARGRRAEQRVDEPVVLVGHRRRLARSGSRPCSASRSRSLRRASCSVL